MAQYFKHPDGTELERAFLTRYHQCCNPILLPEMSTQYVFDPSRKFAFDFAWPAVKVAAECEGEDHMKSQRYASDIYKYNLAASLGWLLIRVTTRDLEGDPYGIFRRITQAIELRRGGGDLCRDVSNIP